MKTISESYPLLNELAEQEGVVILGGAEDMNIPLGELKQAFSFDTNLYNRSVEDLSVVNARDYYDLYIASLKPSCVMLHLGVRDRELYVMNPDVFNRCYRDLIDHIRENHPRCEIAIISIANPSDDPIIDDMNKHLRHIADSERCQFGDVTTPRVWNPRETRSVTSFIYSIGFIRPLTNKHPLGDLIRVLFCYNQKQAC